MNEGRKSSRIIGLFPQPEDRYEFRATGLLYGSLARYDPKRELGILLTAHENVSVSASGSLAAFLAKHFDEIVDKPRHWAAFPRGRGAKAQFALKSMRVARTRAEEAQIREATDLFSIRGNVVKTSREGDKLFVKIGRNCRSRFVRTPKQINRLKMGSTLMLVVPPSLRGGEFLRKFCDIGAVFQDGVMTAWEIEVIGDMRQPSKKQKGRNELKPQLSSKFSRKPILSRSIRRSRPVEKPKLRGRAT